MIKKDCTFCNFAHKNRVIYQDQFCIVFVSTNPINSYHAIIAPVEHFEKFTEIPDDILTHLIKITQKISRAVVLACNPDAVTHITDDDLKGEGYNLISHFKIHVIPRFKDDRDLINFGKLRKKESEENLSIYASTIRENL